uniref:Uncharacterized protein n=1 Tax=Oryza barthii TaxID=65489 RepID=A0A0D3FB16_9ORYZ
MEKAVAQTLKVVRSGRKSTVTISKNTRCTNFIFKLMAKKRRLSPALRQPRHRDRRLLLLLQWQRRIHLRSLARRRQEQRARTAAQVAHEKQAMETLARSAREEGSSPGAGSDGERARGGGAAAGGGRRQVRRDHPRRPLTSPTPCRRRPPRPPKTTTTIPSSWLASSQPSRPYPERESE